MIFFSTARFLNNNNDDNNDNNLRFYDTDGSRNPSQKTQLSVNQHRMKIKESEKINKYLDLAWEQKKSNMRVTVIPIVVCALGPVSRSIEKELEEMEIGGFNQYHPDYSITEIG